MTESLTVESFVKRVAMLAPLAATAIVMRIIHVMRIVQVATTRWPTYRPCTDVRLNQSFRKDRSARLCRKLMHRVDCVFWSTRIRKNKQLIKMRKKANFLGVETIRGNVAFYNQASRCQRQAVLIFSTSHFPSECCIKRF